MKKPLPRDAQYQPNQTALLIVDMQRIWLEPGLDPLHPDGAEHEYYYRELAERVIPNQALLLEAARRGGVEVIYTIIQSLTEDGRDRSLDHKLSSIHLPRNAPEALPVRALAPLADEILLRKTSSGVFNSTNLDYLLRNLGIHYLVVAGIMTDQCVDMAVRDGADLGYRMTCVDDSCAALTIERHKCALQAFGGYCWIANTDTVVRRFEALQKSCGRKA